jgi:hypothetical protein
VVLTLLLACRVEKPPCDACDTPDTGQESTPTRDSPPHDTGESTPVEESVDSVPPPADADADGYAEDVDCDDADPTRHPAADEGCDQVDNDCDGVNALCDDTLAEVTITSTRELDGFGEPAEFAGDVDGDGLDDLLIADDGNYCCYPFVGPGQVLVRAQDLAAGENDEAAVRWTFTDRREQLAPIGDVDGDGRSDLLVVGARDGLGGVGLVTDIASIEGDLDEGLLSTWASTGEAEVDDWPAWLGKAPGDVDGDGIAEFEFTPDDGPHYLVSTDTFTSGEALLDRAFVIDISGSTRNSLADLDGDGLADFSVSNSTVGCCAWFFSGDGLTRGTLYTSAEADRAYGSSDDGAYYRGNGICDLDGDGLLDMAVESHDGVWFLSPSSAATLDDAFATLTSTTEYENFYARDAGDQDGDGQSDLVASAYHTDTYDGALGVWLGGDLAGSLDFETGAAFWIWSDAVRLYSSYGLPSTTGDVNGDGQLDLLFGSYGERHALVKYGPVVE